MNYIRVSAMFIVLAAGLNLTWKIDCGVIYIWDILLQFDQVSVLTAFKFTPTVHTLDHDVQCFSQFFLLWSIVVMGTSATPTHQRPFLFSIVFSIFYGQADVNSIIYTRTRVGEKKIK